MQEFINELNSLKSALSSASDHVESLSALVDEDTKQSSEFENRCETVIESQVVDRAEKLLKWSREKSKALNFGTGLFSDPCWDMCLDIYICDLNDEKIAISSVAHSSGIPMTTAMRYMNVMTEAGLLQKELNPSDSRMIFISTSKTLRDKISSVLAKLP